MNSTKPVVDDSEHNVDEIGKTIATMSKSGIRSTPAKTVPPRSTPSQTTKQLMQYQRIIDVQRKLLKELRDDLVDVLVQYHNDIILLNTMDIKRPDIDINKHFNKDSEKQRPFIDKYFEKIHSTTYYAVLCKNDEDEVMLIRTPCITEFDDHLILSKEMDEKTFDSLRQELNRQGCLDQFWVINVNRAKEIMSNWTVDSKASQDTHTDNMPSCVKYIGENKDIPVVDVSEPVPSTDIGAVSMSTAPNIKPETTKTTRKSKVVKPIKHTIRPTKLD